jgi:hypothetical protein
VTKCASGLASRYRRSGRYPADLGVRRFPAGRAGSGGCSSARRCASPAPWPACSRCSGIARRAPLQISRCSTAPRPRPSALRQSSIRRAACYAEPIARPAARRSRIPNSSRQCSPHPRGLPCLRRPRGEMQRLVRSDRPGPRRGEESLLASRVGLAGALPKRPFQEIVGSVGVPNPTDRPHSSLREDVPARAI